MRSSEGFRGEPSSKLAPREWDGGLRKRKGDGVPGRGTSMQELGGGPWMELEGVRWGAGIGSQQWLGFANQLNKQAGAREREVPALHE